MVGVAATTPSSSVEPAPPPGRTPIFVYVLTGVAVIAGFLFGYDCGVVAGAMLVVRKAWGDSVINDFWQELIVSVMVASAAVSSLLGGVLSDRFGRRPVIISASALFVAAPIIMGSSPAKYRSVLVFGRILVGAAIGLSSSNVPSYVSEATPYHIRGRMVTMFQLFITIGFFLAGLLNAGFSYLPNTISWRLMLGVAAIPSLMQFIAFCWFMPESPRWLATHDRTEEALKVLRKVTSSEDVAQFELRNILHSHEQAQRDLRAKGGSFPLITMLRTPSLRRALTVGCLMQMFQQFCGINTVMYYSTSIVIMSGVRDTTTAIWLSSITSGFNFICTFIGIYFVEKVGRRILTLASTACVFLSLILLGVSFVIIEAKGPQVAMDLANQYDSQVICKYATCDRCSYDDGCGFCYNLPAPNNTGGICFKANLTGETILSANDTPCATEVDDGPIFAHGWCPTSYSWLPLVAMILFLCSFSSGLGPMPWTINAEIYPHWARSTGNACATFVNWSCDLIISNTFLTLSTAITRQGAFFLYAGVTGIGWIVFWLIVPETKNKELEELDHLFARPWCGRTRDEKRRLLGGTPITSGEIKGKPTRELGNKSQT